jgi:hypothetical protein
MLLLGVRLKRRAAGQLNVASVGDLRFFPDGPRIDALQMICRALRAMVMEGSRDCTAAAGEFNSIGRARQIDRHEKGP